MNQSQIKKVVLSEYDIELENYTPLEIADLIKLLGTRSKQEPTQVIIKYVPSTMPSTDYPIYPTYPWATWVGTPIEYGSGTVGIADTVTVSWNNN
jgi:hypothetical protein